MVSLIIFNHTQQIRQASYNLAYFAGKPVLDRVSALIDGDLYEALALSLDDQDPFYIEMQELFREVKRDSQCLHLYTLTVYDDGVHRFILDAEEPDSEYFSYLGEEEDVSVYESAYWWVFETQEPQFAHLEDIATWGLIISAYKPIFNSSGEMVGVIGVDFDSEDIYYTIMSSTRMQIMLVAIFIIVGLVIYFFFLKDLSRQNETLNRLNRSKTDFLQDMSHEMKSPLTIIATGIDYADSIMRKNGDISKAREALETIQEETQRLGRMVSGMVRLAHMDSDENRKRVDLSALIKNNAVAFQMTHKNNSLRVETVSGLPDVFVEQDKFTQVINNLLINAAYHTQNGEIVISADVSNGYITVRVTDTGEGIERSLLPRIFERGVSGRGGTGYGLVICKDVVEAHGGDIKADSEPGKGTAVTFTVPVYGGQEAGHTL